LAALALYSKSMTVCGQHSGACHAGFRRRIADANYVVQGNNRILAARKLGIVGQLRFQQVTLPVLSQRPTFLTLLPSILVGAGKKMAIWQFRLNLIPEKVLLKRYEILPSVNPEDLAENLPWWSDVQPPSGVERQIDLILPQMKSWPESMRMWGPKGSDDCVCLLRG
jgi:hypothetical protein